MIQPCSWCFAPVCFTAPGVQEIGFVFCCKKCQDDFIKAAQEALNEEQDDETDY